MLPPKIQLPPEQQRLLKLFKRLGKSEQQSLIDFAEFLSQRAPVTEAAQSAPSEPAEIPRPQSETVVAAMRRLTNTYHMLDKNELLHEASDLMSAHILQGRPAETVIDELESLFRRHYDRNRQSPRGGERH